MRRLQALKDQAAASAASNPETGPDSNLAAQMLAAAEAASMATQKASTSVAEDAAEERAAAARRHEAVRRVSEGVARARVVRRWACAELTSQCQSLGSTTCFGLTDATQMWLGFN
jgi:hypothetical protein